MYKSKVCSWSMFAFLGMEKYGKNLWLPEAYGIVYQARV